MPSYLAASADPHSSEEDSFSDGTSYEGAGMLSAASRTVMRRVPLRKLGLAMAILAAASAAASVVCVRSTGFLSARKVASGRVNAVAALSEESRSNTTHNPYAKKPDNSETCGKPFSQCGGQDWTGRTCCQRGCVCLKDGDYFSMCVAPAGLDECNVEKAELMALKLRKKFKPLRRRADKHRAVYKVRKARADKLEASFIKARDLAMHALNKAQAARLELDRRNKTYTAAVRKMHRVGWEKDQAVMWWHLVDTANNRSCGDWNSGCQASKCCQHGCACVYKNPYYSQCQPPEGTTTCSLEIAQNYATEHSRQATGTENETSPEDARKVSEAVDAKTAEEKEAFGKAEKKHDQVYKEYMILHKARIEAEKLRDESHEAAERAWRISDKAGRAVSKVHAAADAWSNTLNMEIFK
jgi:hypothetical protein